MVAQDRGQMAPDVALASSTAFSTGPASRRRRRSSGGGGSRPSNATPRRSACGSSKLHKRPPTRNTAPPNYWKSWRGAGPGRASTGRSSGGTAARRSKKPPRLNNTARRYRYSAHLRVGRRNRPPGPFCGGGVVRAPRRAPIAQRSARSRCWSASRCATCAVGSGSFDVGAGRWRSSSSGGAAYIWPMSYCGGGLDTQKRRPSSAFNASGPPRQLLASEMRHAAAA